MKKRKPEFMTQDKRDELNKEMNETMERMKGSTSDRHETYNEALKDWLPEGQRKYAEGKSYEFLCTYLKMFLEGTYNPENLQALRLAKENFENYCETMELKNGQKY